MFLTAHSDNQRLQFSLVLVTCSSHACKSSYIFFGGMFQGHYIANLDKTQLHQQRFTGLCMSLF